MPCRHGDGMKQVVSSGNYACLSWLPQEPFVRTNLNSQTSELDYWLI